MAFDTRQFDIHGFDVSGGMFRYIKAKGVENISSSIGSALNYHVLAIGYERVTHPVMAGVPALAISGSGTEVVDELVAEGNLYINPILRFSETIDTETALGAEIRLPLALAEVIANRLTLGADIALELDGTETVESNTILGADIRLDPEGFELVLSSATADAIEMKVCVLNLTLRPGQRLIIDANNYNILLDGENAIYVQSGDWIDELIRNTTAIDITAASGDRNLQASILYTERFL